MKTNSNDPGSIGLVYFGKVNATISHKLNNILATISETAGLLGDLVEMSEEGIKYEGAPLKSYCDTIGDEIQRGFELIRHMNTFAHSIDKPVNDIRISEALTLAHQLSQCLAYARRVTFDLSETGTTSIYTSPFILDILLYKSFDFSFQAVNPDQEITVSVRPGDNGIQIIYSLTSTKKDFVYPGQEFDNLAKMLQAETSYDSSAHEMRIVLPMRIEME